MHVMGIDIGTTTISIVLLDENNGQLVAHETISHESFLKGENPVNKIQDPQRIWGLTRDKTEELMEKYGNPVCIGLTGQMHGMLYVDKEGEAVSPLYTWQDESGNEPLEEGHTYAEFLKERVGMASSGYGLTTHFYLQRKDKIPVKAAKMTTISDYIAMKLCQNTEPIISSDMAASWGCFDLEKRAFRYQELQEVGVDISYLPTVSKGHVMVGQTKEHIPVISSLGDNQASVLGSVRDFRNTVLLNIGTGSQISFVTEGYIPCEGNVELRPLTEESYIMVGSGLCGGRAYAMLEKFYREVSDNPHKSLYEKMNEHAQDFLEKYGVESAWKVQTTFSGTRSNPGEKGSITGISVENFHPGAMTVGMLLGILKELQQEYDRMCMEAGKKAYRLVGSGNGIRKNPLMQKLAEEMFGMKMEIPVYQEEAACGAALHALWVSGRVNGLEEVQKKILYIQR